MRHGNEYEEFAYLFVQMAEAGGAERARVRDEVIAAHLPLAEHIARKYRNRGQPVEDLEQVARVGLINAVDRFDPALGKPFLAFAVPTIMGEVRRYFRDCCWALTVPRRLKELHLRIAAEGDRLRQVNGRSPTPSELAAALSLSIEEVFEGIEAANAYRLLSLDYPAANRDGDDRPSGLANLVADGNAMGSVDNLTALQPLIAELPDRERWILALRFSGDLTQSQIAELVGLSQMHVSRLLAKTLTTLRAGLAQ